jgi:hypothetical protein
VKRFVVALVCGILPQLAHADPFDHLAEGAPFYGEARPVALASALKRLGVDKLPDIQKLKAQLGVDPLDANLLAPTGIDVAAPIAASLFEPLPGGRFHHRAVATVRDQALFTTFFSAIAISGQAPIQLVDPQTPLGKAGVRLQGALPDGSVVIARLDGDNLIVDAVGAWESNKQAPTALDVVKLAPLKPRAAAAHVAGARRLFAPEAALVFYADGRRLAPFLEIADAPGNKPRPKDWPCRKSWAQAGATFDDMAASMAVDAGGVDFELAWGSQGAAKLGGLHFRPVDDGGLDVEALGKKAPLVLVLYAASLQPFQSLKRVGPQKSFETINDSVNKCGAPAWGHLIVRSWPQAVGALVGEAQASGKAGGDPMMGTALNALGTLRNVGFVLRDGAGATPRGAIAATFDPPARQVLDLFFASAPGGGQPKNVGSRKLTVFHLSEDMGNAVAATDTLAGGWPTLTVSDSDASIEWAYGSDGRLSGAPPLLVAHADGPQLAKMPLMASFPRELLDALQRFRRFDARVATDGDLLRVSVRASAK